MSGVSAFKDEDSKYTVLAALFLGVVFHWVYQVAVAATRDGVWDFGNLGQIAARLVISAVVSVAGLVSAYEQVNKVDPKWRLVSAFVVGLGVDALTSPVLQTNASSGT